MKTKKADINIEDRVQQFLTTAGQIQRKAMKLGKENFLKVLENEITFRHTLSEYFDDGLTLLGKGLVLGRKATELFSAGTHRRAKRLENFTQPVVKSNTKNTKLINKLSKKMAPIPMTIMDKAIKAEKNATSFENKARKNLSRRAKAMQKAISKDKKPRFTTGPISRSH